MKHHHRPLVAPHLLWVYPASPTTNLCATKWLEVTRQLRRLGWRVTLVAEGPGGQRNIRGVEVFCIRKPRVYLLGHFIFHLRLLRFLARESATIDLILFHKMSALWVLPLRLARHFLTGRRRPLLVMGTETLPMWVATWKDRLRAWLDRPVHRLANCLADGQLANTQRMANAVRIPPQKLWGVWPCGVDLGKFAPTQTARRWPMRGESLHLVYIGVLHYERNLMSLCRAVAKANAEGMAFALSLIGDGTERLDLEDFALQTEGRIRVIPPVPHEQIPRWLAQAHIGVLPFPDEQKFRVSSPIKLFEYMGAGLPILATRIVCHTDVVGDGAYAFWAEDASVEGLLVALRLVWQKQDSLSAMGSRAAAAAQAWTWPESAKKLKLALERGLAEFAQ